ncbi:hypothetical protein BDZ89DRAFT_1163494 [Hymenopellis radicata]|nr:hypothetical protein BDZ89DRAFT_1163494 [Hymenopellis radicata]
MPLPRNKQYKRKLARPKALCNEESAPLADAYLDRMDHAVGWNAVISIICEAFKLPDLTTRHGLKKIHADFDKIYARLDEAYDTFHHEEKITGGIKRQVALPHYPGFQVSHRTGFLKRIFPLLRIPTARHLSLRALCAITHNFDIDGRLEIARDYRFLVKSLEDFPDDPVGSELAVAVLSHAVQPVIGFESDSGSPPVLFNEMNVASVLQTVLYSAKYPFASPYLLSHAHSLIAIAPVNCAAICREIPSTITFLVAGLRSRSWSLRCSSLFSLLRLHEDGAEEYTMVTNIVGLKEKIRDFPDHKKFESYAINEVIMAYCAGIVTYKGRESNSYEFGLLLADIATRIPYLEFSLPALAVILGRYLEPAQTWKTCLPICAAAIREKGVESEMHLADILEIKHLCIEPTTAQVLKAFELAERGVERHPQCVFFYNMLCARGHKRDAESSVVSLRWAKKGLKCPKTSHLMRLDLLHYAVICAGYLGVQIMKAARPSDYTWTEGLAFLTSALEDSETYIDEAPRDATFLKEILSWNLLLRIVMKGPTINLDLREFKDIVRKIKDSEEIRTRIGAPSERTAPYRLQETIIMLYDKSVAEWGTAIRRNDLENVHESYVPKNVDQALAKWLEDLPVDDASVYVCNTIRPNPTINSNNVALYRCSWCGTTSAVLRKCSVCDKSRYCDASCQRAHWRVHKRHCRPHE